jgi:hypothetical protein
MYPHESISFREFLYKVFSYFKREADTMCITLSVPPAFVFVRHFNGLQEHAASVFTVEVSMIRMLMGYTG